MIKSMTYSIQFKLLLIHSCRELTSNASMWTLIYPTIRCQASWCHFVVCYACKFSLPPQQVFNWMTNLEKTPLELTESQLLTIKGRIKNWRTKDQVIYMMRNRYGRLEDQAAWALLEKEKHHHKQTVSLLDSWFSNKNQELQ